jgi:BirA family biotin operon repressor/biotin-[acetyl-CoA-carboxylase] ligase
MTEYLQADALKAVVAGQNGTDMDVVVHKTIDSTNSWSLQQCRAGKTLPFACFAEEQKAGRGRRGKQWLMSADTNIALSISWPFDLSYQKLHLLPLSIALAIVDTLEGLKLKHVQIKWPNDVYVRGKKIAGILIETQPVKVKSADGITVDKSPLGRTQSAIVIGIGLNYDMSSFAATLEHERYQIIPGLTDVEHEMKRQAVEQKTDRAIVASSLLQNVVDVCQNFPQDSNQYLKKFRTEYDYCENKTVEIILDDLRGVTGIAQGVSDNAELIVLIDGKERLFNSAEVSVKARNLSDLV